MLSVLRIVTAFLFVLHGTQKYFNFPSNRPPRAISITSMLGVAGLIELISGPLLIVGLFTRPVAFLVSGEMAVAYFLSHAPRNPWPLLNGGEHTVLFCFIFLYLAVAGGGVWALDAIWRRAGRGGSGRA
jgi:putative oxidoreductase